VDLEAFDADRAEYEYQRLFNTDLDFDDFSSNNPVFTYDADISPVVASIWDDPQIGPALQEAIAAEGCDLIIAIGGTTLMPDYLEHMSRWTQRPVLELPEAERMAAVADGAVWAYAAHLDCMLADDIQMGAKMGREKKIITVLPAFRPIRGLAQLNRPYRRDPNDAFEITLVAMEDRAPRELAQITLPPSSAEQVRVQINAVDDRTMLLSIASNPNASMPLWEVRL